MRIQAPEERIRWALNQDTKNEGPSATTAGITSVTDKDLEENSMEEDSTDSTSTSSSFEATVTPQSQAPPQLSTLNPDNAVQSVPGTTLPLSFGADIQSVPGTTPSQNPAPLQLLTLNPGSAVAIPPIQQPPASLPLLFGADIQSVPRTTPSPNPAPLQLSTLNPSNAVAIPPIQQPPASLPLPFAADVLSDPGPAVPRTTPSPNPAPLQLSTLNPSSAVAIPPIQQLPASLPLPFVADVLSDPGQTLTLAATLNPAAVNTVDQPLYNLPAPLASPIPETATATPHHLPFEFPATGWVGSVPTPFINSNNTTNSPSWDFSEPKNKTDGMLLAHHRTEWGNNGESFSFTDYLNAPVNNLDSYDFGNAPTAVNGSNIPVCSDMICNFLGASLAVNNAPAPMDMSVSSNIDSYLPQVLRSSDKENSEVIQAPTNLSSAENGSALGKENEGLDCASRSRRPTTSKEITAIWRESAYAYFCQELDSEEWKKCIDLWLEFEKTEESGLETNSVSI